MELLRDPVRLDALVRANSPPELVADFDAADWLAKPAHFALAQGNDLALFEAGEWPGPLTAHVLFASRGKEALQVARRMLAQAFAFGATEIRGETQAELRHALLFIRMLGFKPYGEKMRDGERFILSNLNNTAAPKIVP